MGKPKSGAVWGTRIRACAFSASSNPGYEPIAFQEPLLLIRGGRQQSSALPGRVATIPMILHGMIVGKFGLLRRATRLCAFAAVIAGVAMAGAVAAPAPKAADGSFQTAAPYA